MPSGKRIVLTTFGSLGDLHPYVAVALGLRDRGHQPVIATTSYYRDRIEREGIEFAPVRPDFADRDQVKRLVSRVMDMKRGPEVVIREVVLAHLRDTFEDLLQAATGADLLVTHTLTFAGPIVAEKLRLPWVSTTLAPLAFFSAYDEMVIAPAPWLSIVHRAAPPVYRALLRLAIKSTTSWTAPVRRLRREEGLPPPSANPIFLGSHSPYLVLALFSRVLSEPMPDWPANTRITGFPFYDRHADAGLEPELDAFLSAGPPPVVFTLGSSAVMDAGRFYEESTEAVRQMGLRALLLIGDEPGNRPVKPLSDQFGVFAYAPYSQVFPRCSAIVHQGGVGTTGQALRSGRPMLVVPYAQDQPDNAARVVRLGVARTIARGRYQSRAVVRELGALLNQTGYTATAAEVAGIVRGEDGVKVACDALERLLSTLPDQRG